MQVTPHFHRAICMICAVTRVRPTTQADAQTVTSTCMDIGNMSSVKCLQSYVVSSGENPNGTAEFLEAVKNRVTILIWQFMHATYPGGKLCKTSLSPQTRADFCHVIFVSLFLQDAENPLKWACSPIKRVAKPNHRTSESAS